jgi:hypothetical protein
VFCGCESGQFVEKMQFFRKCFFDKLADLLCRFPLTTFSKKKLIQKKIQKKIQKIFREIFFSKFFWAITVPHPIWSMPAKIFGGARPAGLGGDRERTNST